MELHSYAKRRATPKKWTIEQKRKLVAARIAHESLFAEKPRESVLPWKKILSITNLDDYNVFFVRKQWSNMIAKYKQYKQSRLGHIPTQAIDDDMIQAISQEWEFFATIHEYMMRKTRNLHSYALQHYEEPILEPNSNSNSTQSSTECVHVYTCSSDTNDIPSSMVRISEFAIGKSEATQNTDHDFYSKKWVEQQLQQKQHNYFADASEDTQESSIMMELKTENLLETSTQSGTVNEVIITSTQQLQLQQKQQEPMIVPMDIQQQSEISVQQVPRHEPQVDELPINNKKPRNQTKLSERDRYYRHKRRFNRRFERRFDAILQVVGQVVKAEYPSIDVSPLMQVANAAIDLGGDINGQIFSSGDEFDDESDDEILTQGKLPQNAPSEEATTAAKSPSRWYI